MSTTTNPNGGGGPTANASHSRTFGDGVLKSVLGLGVTNPDEFGFSPPNITTDNAGEILSEVEPVVQTTVFGRLRLLALSAVIASEHYKAKVLEATAEVDRQESEWQFLVRQPLVQEVKDLQSRKVQIAGKEALLRAEAAGHASVLGLDFERSDLDSLQDCQEMIARNVASEAEERGLSGTTSIKADTPWWMDAISNLSPLLLSLLTAIGLLKLLSGQDIQLAIFSPMFPVAIALALGITVPALVGAYRFGWMIAVPKSSKNSMTSAIAVLVGIVIVASATALLASIDAFAVQALAEDMLRKNARVGVDQPVNPWLQWIGFGFMVVGMMSKVWSGYCDSLENSQEDKSAAIVFTNTEAARLKATPVMQCIAQADSIAAELDRINEELDERGKALEDLTFTPKLSKELIEETATERNAWIGESGRFWVEVIEAVNNHPLAPAERPKMTARLARFFDSVRGKARQPFLWVRNIWRPQFRKRHRLFTRLFR